MAGGEEIRFTYPPYACYNTWAHHACADRLIDVRRLSMSFNQEKARMRRILMECAAPPEVIADFDDLCRYRSTENAEDLLRDICIRHGFTAPYAEGNKSIVFRACSLDSHHPDYHCDSPDRNLVAEQSYRRGYDQGGNDVLRMIRAGSTISEVEDRLRRIHEWRVQPIQNLNSLPGCAVPQVLPERWKRV